MTFEAELRWGREEEQLQRETLEKHRYSPYIAEVEGWPDSEGKGKYIGDLKRLRHFMILFKLGYGSREMTMLKVNSKNRYPEAFDPFGEELEAM